MISDYKKLIVWQKSIQLVKAVYVFTSKLPKDEQYGLVSQMRRCAVSIPSNIAEGVMRRSAKELKSFLFISFGSGGELETQLEICKELGYVKDKEIEAIENLLQEVMKMLNAFILKVDATVKTTRI